jgi:hypothetical protein
MAGLIAATCHFRLNEQILGYVTHSKEVDWQQILEKSMKEKDMHDNIFATVQTIRAKSSAPDKW